MRIEVALIIVPWQPCSLRLLLQTHSPAHRSSGGRETNLHLGMGEKEKANRRSLCACAHHEMSVALPEHPHPLPAPHRACADATAPLHPRPLSCALSSTLSSPGRGRPEEPPDFSSFACCPGQGWCCGCCCGASSVFPLPGTTAGSWYPGMGSAVGSGSLLGLRAGEHPLHIPPRPPQQSPALLVKCK